MRKLHDRHSENIGTTSGELVGENTSLVFDCNDLSFLLPPATNRFDLGNSTCWIGFLFHETKFIGVNLPTLKLIERMLH